MKRKLLQNFAIQKKSSIILLIGLFIVGFNQNAIAQCSVTTVGTVNSSTLICHTSPLSGCDNGTLTIGDGTSITNIYMDAELNLTCLGAIQVNVKNNGSFDFSPGNNRLYLAEGSSITFESGSGLIGGSCNASERIYIGTNLLASCNGGAGADLSFANLLAYGGTGSLSSNSPVCVGDQIILTATPPPTSTGTFTYSFSGPGLTATSYSSSPTYSFAATVGSSGVYQVRIKNSNIASPLIAEMSVTVNSLPGTPTISPSGPTTFCAGGSVTLTSSGGIGYLWSTGATTPSISPTTSDSYSVKVINANGCQSASSSATIVTVNPNLPASVSIGAFPSGAICSGTSVTFTATPINGGTTPVYQWKLNGVNVGTNATTYTNATLANGDVVTCEMTSNAAPCLIGSPATSGGITMIVNGVPSPPTVSPTLILGCSATGFLASWNASTTATNYRFDVATDAGFSPLTILSAYNNKDLGNVLSTNVTGLTGTTFYVRLRAVNSCGPSANSNTITISIPTTTYTLPGGWDNGVPSASNKIKAIFASDYSITTVLEACSCQINSGVNVVAGTPGGLNNTAILKIENGLDVAPTGSLTFENNASLVQVNDDAVNSGKIIYKRNTNEMKNLDYTYWCSPVKDQILNVLSPNTQPDKYFYYANGAWVAVAGTNPMNPAGKGFIIRVPKPNILYPNTEYWTGPTYIQKVAFQGEPNNGEILIGTQGASKYNLIGNPYPSAIDADSFINGNVGMVGGALYFWTHNTAITNNVYTFNDYAVYTLTGGTAATTGGGAIPNGKIASGVAFFVRSISDGSFVFNNSMRNSADVLDTGSGGPNSQFFKMSNTKKGTAAEKNRVWLNLTNSGGAFKQLLVGYVAGATNDFDRLYDGVTFNSNAYIDFYSINKTSNLSIQGRALPFEKTDQVPLGYKTTIKGIFTINIDRVEGILVDQSIFIEDKVTGVIVDLKKGPYNFSTETGVFKDRFVLRFLSNTITAKTLDARTDEKVEDSVIVSVKNSQIKINSFNETIDKVMVYDLKGSLIYEKQNVNNNEFSVSDFNSSEQFLIVQILLKNGKWVTQEIVF